MSIEDQLFLSSISNQKETNLESAKRKFKKKFAGDTPKTLQEYADANNLTLAQANKELLDKGVRLQNPTNFRNIKDGAGAFFTANYDLEDELEVLPSGKVVAKNRPKNFGRFASGLLDIATLGLTDFDQQGGLIGGKISGLGYNINTGKYDVGITKSGRKKLLNEKVSDAMEDVEFDVLGNVVGGTGTGSSSSGKTVMDQIMDYKKKSREFERKERRKDMVDNQLNYLATEPMRQAFANRAAEAAAQRGLRIRAAKEGMPSNIQNIMLSKQAQSATASSAEAERARAAADQQDAASRFAALGTARRFG
jgi:hypothetical protein